MKAWGLVIWKLAKEANDGRIWPEAINGQRKVWQMAIRHQRGPIGHKRYGVANWPQLGSRLELPQHPWRRIQSTNSSEDQDSNHLELKKTPKNVPIDFYRPEWFNERDQSEKLMAADLSEVAFVPAKELPPKGKQHPNERLGDLSFNYKYWDSTIKDYDIEPRTLQSSERDSDAGNLSDDESVDLDAANSQCDVDHHLVNKQIIKLEQGEIELEPEENNKEFEESQGAAGDVIMSDAWESSGRKFQHLQTDYYEEIEW
ncbi:hypothetical protein O181_099250 [Austropuccinia psidii MF-1]|uniref:Uncharacterized protein n=1 Tax=Austropuccinia psidii MF-1 TaxID=1389203 RepID=A0A9Q3PFQ4_9BASI|nr:hypothetical protein [Austropuccinia psidii MF-1]